MVAFRTIQICSGYADLIQLIELCAWRYRDLGLHHVRLLFTNPQCFRELITAMRSLENENDDLSLSADVKCRRVDGRLTVSYCICDDVIKKPFSCRINSTIKLMISHPTPLHVAIFRIKHCYPAMPVAQTWSRSAAKDEYKYRGADRDASCITQALKRGPMGVNLQ